MMQEEIGIKWKQQQKISTRSMKSERKKEITTRGNNSTSNMRFIINFPFVFNVLSLLIVS